MSTFEVTFKGKKKDLEEKAEGFMVVRHTRASDVFLRFIDNRDYAMDYASDVAQEAANTYGHGAASVYPATLKITGPALKSDDE
jgi:hypothetical protein